MQKESFPLAYTILSWFLPLRAAISSTFPSTKKTPFRSWCRKAVKLESWKAESGDQPNADCCAWDGVECDEVTGHVIGLNLSCSCLFNPSDLNTCSIFQLHHLRNLNLAFNDFNSSPIPLEVGNFGFMTNLNLSDSNFKGQVPPSLGNLTRFIHLILSRNSLFGAFQLQLQHLTQLAHLDISRNLFNGTIPSYFGNFSRMKYLNIFYNKLGCKIPLSLRHLACSNI